MDKAIVEFKHGRYHFSHPMQWAVRLFPSNAMVKKWSKMAILLAKQKSERTL